MKLTIGTLAALLAMFAFGFTLKAALLTPLLYVLLLGVFYPERLECPPNSMLCAFKRSNSLVRCSINGIMIAIPAAILLFTGLTPWGWCVGSCVAGIIYLKV